MNFKDTHRETYLNQWRLIVSIAAQTSFVAERIGVTEKRNFLERVFTKLVASMKERQVIESLEAVDNHILKDIGIRRSQIPVVATSAITSGKAESRLWA